MISRHMPRAIRSSLTGRNGCRACASSDGRQVVTISSRVVSIRRARYASRSVVDGSAQCMSSKHRTTGCIRPSSSNSAAISRFSRSCDPAAVSAASRAADESFSDGGMICAYQLGASARIRRAMLPSCSFFCRLSSASRIGRYASVPASRSEQRPRPMRTGSCCSSSCFRNASTSVVLPMPASAEITTSRPLPRCARSNSCCSASSSWSRPTMSRDDAARPAA